MLVHVLQFQNFTNLLCIHQFYLHTQLTYAQKTCTDITGVITLKQTVNQVAAAPCIKGKSDLCVCTSGVDVGT